MRKASYRDATHYRSRAEECRTIAELFSNPEMRQKMMKVAAEYEQMARTVEEAASVLGDSEK